MYSGEQRTMQSVFTCGTGSLKVEIRRALITSFSASAMALNTQTNCTMWINKVNCNSVTVQFLWALITFCASANATALNTQTNVQCESLNCNSVTMDFLWVLITFRASAMAPNTQMWITKLYFSQGGNETSFGQESPFIPLQWHWTSILYLDL